MALFRRDYNKPGPGVSKDEPRKKGVRRYLEIISRHISDLIKLNVLFCLCALPTVAAFILGLAGFLAPIMLILSLVAAFPIGGALVAMIFCITKMLRDDPGFIWHDFKRKFLENVKQASLPGILYAAMIYSQILMWYTALYGGAQADLIWSLIMLILFLIFAMVAPYVFLMFGYIDLKASQIVKNGILMSLAKAPRSIMGAILGGIAWIVFFLYLPFSILFTPVIILIGFSFTWLITLMWVWPPVDKQFAIEETIRKRQGG